MPSPSSFQPGHRDNPISAKNCKDNFNQLVQGLVDSSDKYLDVDGTSRIYVKCANGRTAVIEEFQKSDDLSDMTDSIYVHECPHTEIKKFWSSVIAGIVFDVGFSFKFRRASGSLAHLIFHRDRNDGNMADGFCVDILTGLQVNLEDIQKNYLLDQMEKGFKRLEKLIKEK